MKKILCIALALALLLGGCAPKGEPELPAGEQTEVVQKPQTPPAPAPEPSPVPDPTPEQEPLPEGTVYVNVYDGYRLTLGEGFTVDDTFAEIATFFRRADTTVEIYRQPLEGLSVGNYTTYSNAFLKNTADHTLDFQRSLTLGGRSFTATAWHREALFEGDQNYYMDLQTRAEGALYSIFIKSADPAQDPMAYEFLGGLEFFPPTAETPIRTTKTAPRGGRWNRETRAFYDALFSWEAPQSWGIFEPYAANGDHQVLNGYEQTLGWEFPILVTYLGLDESAQAVRPILDAAWAEGKVLELTIQTGPTADGSNMLYGLLRGEYDGILDHYATAFKDFSHPILLRMMNEMNGDWCAYSALHSSKDTALYRAAYRYIYTYFQAAGVENTIWVWNPNERSFPDFKWNDPLMYYPGDDYVDVVGMTAYNNGTYYAHSGETWREFSTLYEDLYATYSTRFSQPLMITEFSCAEMGGDKRKWTEDMFQKLKTLDRIKVAVWWDHVDYDPAYPPYTVIARDYRIASVLDLFKTCHKTAV